jgi:uncharacterized protein
MNYTLVSEAVTFRTGINTEASHGLFDHPIAFEVDQVDEFLRTGWSVLVMGNAQPLDEESLLLLDVGQKPEPAGGQTTARRATAAYDDDRPPSPPVLDSLGGAQSHDQPIRSRKTRLR